MRKVIVALPVILLGSSIGEARQDAPARQGFFNQEVVDFWRDGSPARTVTANSGAIVSESIWAEPIRLPDGRTTTYVPPRPVLAFLENPTRENAQKYLAWQSERMDKLRKAAEMLSEVKREKRARATKSQAVARARISLTYFKKAG